MIKYCRHHETRKLMKRESLFVDCLQMHVRNSVVEFLLDELEELEGGPRGSICYNNYYWYNYYREASGFHVSMK